MNFYNYDEIDGYCKGDNKTLNELYVSCQPTEVDITTLADINNGQRVYVDSPDGYVLAEQWRNKGIKQCYNIVLTNGQSITSSHDHLFQDEYHDWIYARDLKIDDKLLTDSGLCAIKEIYTSGYQTVYDLAIQHENHRYYTNGISSHNSGKSIFLQNIALNWIAMGLNVIYITLELSEDLVSERFDAMISQFRTGDILKNIDSVALKIANVRRGAGGVKAGDLKVKKFSEAGTTVNAIKAYLKEYEIKEGKRPDGIVIDYLDLLYPNNSKIDITNAFAKDKQVSEEMRSIGGEWDIPIVSASQLNRSSIEAQEFDHSMIAGGISKINSCDFLAGIFTSLSMRESGKYQIQFLKTRSAAAVGHKMDLAYDPSCMRVTDMPNGDEDDDPHMANQQTTQTVAATAIIPNTNIAGTVSLPVSPPSAGSAQRAGIEAMLAKLKKDQ